MDLLVQSKRNWKPIWVAPLIVTVVLLSILLACLVLSIMISRKHLKLILESVSPWQAAALSRVPGWPDGTVQPPAVPGRA
jgi:hypothetical protein